MTLYIMVGISGSGKSTYARTIPNTIYVSRDEIRFSLLEEGDSYFAHERKAYRIFTNRIAEALSAGHDVVADATHLTWQSRQKLINSVMSKTNALFDIVPVVIETGYNVCRKRNEQRSGVEKVPLSVLRRQSFQITDPADDPFEYTKIERVEAPGR